MPTPRPTDTPEWASTPSGGAAVVEPPSGLQIRGWIPFQKPPAAFINWGWNRFSTWVAHFGSTASSFPTLEGAANAPATAPLVVGDSCLINEPDGVLPGVVTVVGMDAILGGGADRAAGGDGVLYGGAFGGVGRVRLNERDGSALIREYTLTNASTGVDTVLYDGVDVVAAYTDGITLTLECWDAKTGVSKWVVTPVVGVTVINDLAWDATQIYLVSNLVNAQLKAIDRTTGATNYTYDHGVGGIGLRSVATNGFLVFVQGNPSTLPSGATLRGIVASNGFDFTGEGGLGTDAIFAWDVVEVSASVTDSTIATDGRTLYTASGIAPAVLELRGCADGVAEITRTLSAQANVVAVDQDQVYIVDTGSVLLAYTKTSLVQAWKQTSVTSNVITDGSALFAGNDRLARGNRPPYIFRRVDPSVETQLPLRQLLVPVSRN